ncbi:MAG: pyridoxal-phosphate dependent enzyme [Anderseniella sp.]|nr:pyridoxal-phosphate dependent enzyme [Anderseniella sp.]
MTIQIATLEDVPVFAPNPASPFALLAACPAYAATPLVTKTGPTGRTMLVKDETKRMNLGAFKALGGVYAVARMIGDAWHAAGNDPLSPEDYVSDAVKAFAADMTFVCATAGNHGLAVAAGARIFGAQARIFLASEVPAGFETRLRETQGAQVVRAGDDYAQSLDAAKADAAETGAILLADGSWPGYSERPLMIMEGYTVIAEELREAFEQSSDWPTHVFLQAGVGGIAGAVTHMIRENWAVQPEIIVVEPNEAPCLTESHAAGYPVQVTGGVSNMGRLDCKEPSLIAFGIFERTGVHFMTVTDAEAQDAANRLGSQGLATTPSGAAGLAGLKAFGEVERPLIIVTEGAV